jgi:hypothetical protein
MSNYGNDDNDHDDYDIIECLCITVMIMMVACRGDDSNHTIMSVKIMTTMIMIILNAYVLR